MSANSAMFNKFCNCFVAGTCVETPEGCAPIECVEEGDEIITRDQDKPSEAPKVGRVTRVFRSIAPAIMWLSLANGAVLGATPGHEVWTHQDGWTLARQLEVGDSFADRDGAPVEIIDIRIDPGPTPVYNLEVDGAYTYFAEGVWVHNNSCPIGKQLSFHFHHALAKFLGGAENGVLALLPPHLHQTYHGGLLSALAQAGVNKPKSQKWFAFFEKYPEKQDVAWNTLMDYTRDFDSAHGTGLISALWEQIHSQLWK